MVKIITETYVEEKVRKYLKEKGWTIAGECKKRGEHGIDIKCIHKKWRKIFIIEAKGDGKSHMNQKIHNDFYTLLGQILSRMDKEGNSQNKARYYGIAIPYTWKKQFAKKIKNMLWAWNLLKLKIFLVDKKGSVVEMTHKQFLK